MLRLLIENTLDREEKIMTEWEKVKVGDIGKVITGKTPKTSNCEYYGGNIPFLTPSDDMSVKYVRRTNKYITELGRLSVKNATLPANAICVSCIGSDLGKVVITTQETVTNQQINSIVVDTDKFDIDFVYYSMLELGKILKFHSKTSTAVPIVNKSSFSQYEIDCPKLNTQKKIGAILSSIDKKIEENNQINNNLLQQLDTLYDEFSHRKNWSTVIINDIAEKVAMGPFGSNIKVSTFVSEGVPIISGNHLRGYFLEEPSFNYITEEHAQRLKNSLVYPKDIVFTHAGNIGQVAMIPDDCRYPMYVLSQRQFYLRCDTEKAIPEYVVLFFHSKQGQHELLSYANQTGVPSIAQPATNLKKIPLKLPPIDEQRQWLQVVSPIIKLYQSNVYENEHLSSMRDSLLPKLMSGELVVSDIDL